MIPLHNGENNFVVQKEGLSKILYIFFVLETQLRCRSPKEVGFVNVHFYNPLIFVFIRIAIKNVLCEKYDTICP